MSAAPMLAETRQTLTDTALGTDPAAEFQGLGANSKSTETQAVVDQIDAEISQAASFKARISTLHAAVEALPGSISATGRNRANRQLRNTPPSARQPPLTGFQPGRFHPDAVRAIEKQGYPKNRSERTSARAPLYDSHGSQTTPGEEEYRAYVKGQQPYRPELVPAFNNPEHTTTP